MLTAAPRGDVLFVNFIDLPSRQYKDYFNVIQDPLSLRGLFKLVTGKKGRAPPTGRTKFTSWQAFGEKASLLWTNAHYYNEEGSEVYVEATKLKVRISRTTFFYLVSRFQPADHLRNISRPSSRRRWRPYRILPKLRSNSRCHQVKSRSLREGLAST